jgi:glucose/arabinose dehydrogenase
MRSAAGLMGLALLLGGCGESAKLGVADGFGPDPKLPPPVKTALPTVNIAEATGWPAGAAPAAAQGLRVNAFAEGLDHPRWMLALPNGDVLVAETNKPPKPDDKKGGIKAWIAGLVMKKAGAAVPSANRITLLRDSDGDGLAELKTPFLTGLYSPFGMALVGSTLYVANANAVVAFPYQEGATRIDASPRKITDLPAGRNHHWTKSLVASRDGSRLYVGVGSNSNVAEHGMGEEQNRAAILEIDPATGATRLFASGLRNPVGMDWNPESGALWTAVNERDEIGSDLVPDYMTSVRPGRPLWLAVELLRPGGRRAGEAAAAGHGRTGDQAGLRTRRSHCLARPHFFRWRALGPSFANGAFIGQHGSWNRKPRSGYKVIFVPFAAASPPEARWTSSPASSAGTRRRWDVPVGRRDCPRRLAARSRTMSGNSYLAREQRARHGELRAYPPGDRPVRGATISLPGRTSNALSAQTVDDSRGGGEGRGIRCRCHASSRRRTRLFQRLADLASGGCLRTMPVRRRRAFQSADEALFARDIR